MAIDEERGSSIDAAAHASREVGPYAGPVSCLRDRSLQLRRKQVEVFRELDKERVAEICLVFIEQIVHLPELAVGAGKLSHFSGRLCPGMHLSQGEIAEDKGETFSEVFLKFLDDRISLTTVGALIVPIFDQAAFRSMISLDMVFGADCD